MIKKLLYYLAAVIVSSPIWGMMIAAIYSEAMRDGFLYLGALAGLVCSYFWAVEFLSSHKD